jgi:hypothetical protein
MYGQNRHLIEIVHCEHGRHTSQTKHYTLRLHCGHSELKLNNALVTQISMTEYQANMMTEGLIKGFWLIWTQTLDC